LPRNQDHPDDAPDTQDHPRDTHDTREPATASWPLAPSRDVAREPGQANRDATRTKTRRHATKAQRAARDRAGNRKLSPEPAPRARPARSSGLGQGHPDRRDPLKAVRERAQELRRRGQRTPDERNDAARSGRNTPTDARTPYSVRGRTYSITDRQAQVLHDLGRFRVIRTDSLARHVYAGDRTAQVRELRDLTRQGLAEIYRHRSHGPEPYAALSRPGRELATEHLRSDNQQVLYSGLKQPQELRHDAAIYDAFHRERARLEDAGSRVVRVHLDYELKRQVNHDLHVERTTRSERPSSEASHSAGSDTATIQVVAARYSLPTHDDSIDYPDLQIEYERPDGSLGRANVEIVTEHYTAASLEQKSAAGFSLYLPGDSAGARGGARGIQSLAEDIFSL
jgi:hypothetical protein